MMTITDKALGHLAAALAGAEGASDTAAIRIVANEQGWVLRLDEPRPEDETFDHEGRTVLILAPDVAERLEDNTLDLDDTNEGARLKLR